MVQRTSSGCRRGVPRSGDATDALRGGRRPGRPARARPGPSRPLSRRRQPEPPVLQGGRAPAASRTAGGLLGRGARRAHDVLRDAARRFVDCFVGAIDDVGMPDDPAFRAAMRAYMEWATGRFIAYPDDPTDVPEGLAVPRWGWDGLIRT